jgi:antitoxin CptB
MSERDRIKWHCRRGMLELDLVLERFVERHLDALDRAELDAFRELLTFDDGDLFDMVMGRAEPQNAQLNEVLEKMRSV